MAPWQHSHTYLRAIGAHAERQTRRVIALTAAMMVAEIAAGSAFHSMALLADGWHMASHAAALGITALAYLHARRSADDPRYSFGTWKVGVLGGYTSAVLLAVIAVLIAWESLDRLFEPLAIGFDEAISVACVGLAVNLVSARMLHAGNERSRHGNDHSFHHHDHNLRGAYLHVLADALTSLTAIFALLTGKLFGWIWMDPLMGLVGSAVIGRWAYGLLRESAKLLVDRGVEADVPERVRAALQGGGGARVADLHVWRVGPQSLAAAICVVASEPKAPEHYRALALEVSELDHVTIEVHRSSPAGRAARLNSR